MSITETKMLVADWLLSSPARKTVNNAWTEEYITDAAQMLMEAYCKIEQLEIAHKGIVAENKRLADLRDAKTEELRNLLRQAESKLSVSCNRPLSLIAQIRDHLRIP